MSEDLKNSSFNKCSSSEFKQLFGSLVARCDELEIDIILEALEPLEHISENSILIKQGEYVDSLYLVCNGLLSVVINTDEEQFNIGMLGEGQWVGDVSIIEPGPASATIRVLEDVSVLRLTQHKFILLRQKHPATASRLMKAMSVELANRLRESRRLSLVVDRGAMRQENDQESSVKFQRFLLGISRWLSGVKV